jgi:Zn-dependent protease with chaperone function
VNRRLQGRFQDGRTSASLPAGLEIWIETRRLIVRLADRDKEYPLDAVEISPRVGRIPRRFEFPDGASFETEDNDAVDALLRAMGKARGARAAHRLESRAAWALAAALATTLIVWSLLAWGIPFLAERAAYAIPEEMEARLGRDSLETLDGLAFEPSRLDAARQAHVRRLFAALADGTEGRRRLEFRAMKNQIANAFSLPGGLVVVTDRLVELADRDEELQAVLAHELGHAHHRHGLRSWLQDSVAVLVVASALGDISSISANVAALPAVLLETHYSRVFEIEADDYAAQTLAARGIDPIHLANALKKLEADQPSGAMPGFLSTHPSTEERAERLRRNGAF